MISLETYIEDPCTGACFAGPAVTVRYRREGEQVLLHFHIDQHPRFGEGAEPLEVKIQTRTDWTALQRSSLALVATLEDMERLLAQVRVKLDLCWSWLPPAPQNDKQAACA